MKSEELEYVNESLQFTDVVVPGPLLEIVPCDTTAAREQLSDCGKGETTDPLASQDCIRADSFGSTCEPIDLFEDPCCPRRGSS